MNKTTGLNLTEVPKELICLLELVKNDNVNDILLNGETLFKELDWNLFLDLAQHHRIYPAVYPKLKLIGDNYVPKKVKQTMEHQYKQNTFRMLQLSAEMEQIGSLFSSKKIRLLVLKGPVLAADLYGDISKRTCGDLDVLIPIGDLEKTDEMLLKEGYIKDDYIHTVLGDWKWRHHHVTYFHKEKPIKLEIHWRLNPGPGNEPRFEDLWARKRKSSLANSSVYYLGREDLFTFLISHGARHGWSRLRWLMDIGQMLGQEMDWGVLNKFLGKYSSKDVGGQALVLASQLLHSVVPPPASPLIHRTKAKSLAQQAVFYLNRMINLHADHVPVDVSEYHKKHLFSLMGLQQKILFVLSFLYPYPEDAETLPLPKQFHFFYFPLRPFLWAWRKSKNQVLSRRVS